MKLAKTTVLALAVSAAMAGPVLAQGLSTDTQTRGGAQGKTATQPMSGSGDEEMEATTPTQKGVNAKPSTKGTVGAGHGSTTKGTGADTTGSKRY
jgi:hypothetical protein